MITSTEPISASELNQQFGLKESLIFRERTGGLVMADVRNPHATATIALHGAQVLAFAPHGERDILWVSRHSHFEEGKAIRGGIPICWPWFGGHPAGGNLPSHGFARNSIWQVEASQAGEDGSTTLIMALEPSEWTESIWPSAFRLEMHITVGETLDVALHAINPGDEPWTYTGALHTYFRVSDISNVGIHGLDATRYIDQLQEHRPFVQAGPIKFAAETDLIFFDTPATCILEDKGLQRKVRVAKTGSRSTVVWNPWIEKGERMGDFGDLEYREMVCIETANAAKDTVTVLPGNRAVLGTQIGLVTEQ